MYKIKNQMNKNTDITINKSFLNKVVQYNSLAVDITNNNLYTNLLVCL